MKAAPFDTRPVEDLLAKHAKHTTAYITEFRGLDLVIFPGVFNPSYTKVTGFLADEMKVEDGELCLEMFSGSGALSFISARKGGTVVGIEISRVAVSCARENARRLGLEDRVEFRKGDLWLPLQSEERFDVIIANPPLLPAIPETSLERTVADSPEMSLTRRFIFGCTAHLRASGRVYMAFSDACRVSVGAPLDFLRTLAKQARLDMSVEAEWDVGYEIYRIVRFERETHQ